MLAIDKISAESCSKKSVTRLKVAVQRAKLQLVARRLPGQEEDDADENNDDEHEDDDDDDDANDDDDNADDNDDHEDDDEIQI